MLFQRISEAGVNTSEDEWRKLVEDVQKVNYASNCEAYASFYLPMVAHILFYKPVYHREILGYIVGPVFALGYTGAEEVIEVVAAIAREKMKENLSYLSQSGLAWLQERWPYCRDEIQLQINQCNAELESGIWGK